MHAAARPPPAFTAEQIAALTRVRPSERQLDWQEMGFYAFVHFGMNTMTDREWGLGDEDPAIFDPSALDVDQWMRAFADAGMTGAILTAKHHDGFCLWPSAVSTHTVAQSPWRGGKGDLAREFADAARRHGLKLGIYLSPWDRHEPTYGSGRAYDDFFVRQLEEVLGGGYGDVFSVWFDGANGEGPDGRRQEYDWDRYYGVIRRLQPGAVITVCGPDVRWCGNEAGHTRANEWSVVPGPLRDAERIAERSQQADDGEFSRLVRSDEEDLGSRRAIAGHLDDLVWYPAEVNTSIRPGWFYHAVEDERVRDANELFALWASAAGGNACLLLNVPPRPDGLVAPPDVAQLRAVGERIRAFERSVVPAEATASSGTIADGPAGLGDPFAPGRRVAWSPSAEDAAPALTLRFREPTALRAVVVREAITEGQRLEDVVFRSLDDGAELASAASVGYQRIVFLKGVVSGVRVEFRQSRGVPALRAVAAIASA